MLNNYDAIIGDVTILANRSKYVEFTQPYIESSLTMVVTEKLEAEKAWMFLKPFTIGMWVATGAILTYTIFVVWLLERQSNPEFEGPWKRQLGTAFWFTCSSLFFAQSKEKVHNSYTRVVVVAWLFVVLVLNSSYTANLSSMLTVKRLQPNVTSLDWLKSHDAMIGYDSNSFVNKYLADVLGFKPHNIKSIDVQEQYLDEFRSGNISAAFLELPFERAFLQRHCIGYTGIVLPDRFGGFGFVFQKGSPIAADFSEAILNLSETGVLKRLEAKWFSPSSECLTHEDSSQTGSLSWKSFGGLFLFTGFTSTFCFLLSLVHGWFAQHSHEPLTGGSTATNRNLLTNLARFFLKKKVRALEGNSGQQLETSMHQITCNK
ncbi:unnamed protein product [Thlaspi arvense]|uniref:Ionotropic glutamate receptor C-terminal domain-containing protein n=1 Tax=Thlaspi arvense TaxID=13288 RepID=A0AAU9RFA5_THLAR|nr:unnamed protein product [Thlaspi arvense]